MTNYDFRVLDPSWHSYAKFRDEAGTIRLIPESVYCAVFFQTQFRPILISIDEDSRLFEAVLFLGLTFRSGPIANRYLNLYKAYESITDARRPQLSAVRHALGHSGTALTKPNTVAPLERLFGGTYINLDLYRHRSELFRQFGGMLIETDRLIYEAITRQCPRWTRIRSWSQLHFDQPASPSNIQMEPTRQVGDTAS